MLSADIDAVEAILQFWTAWYSAKRESICLALINGRRGLFRLVKGGVLRSAIDYQRANDLGC